MKNGLLIAIAIMSGSITPLAAAKKIPLKKVDLYPIPEQMCGFKFRDTHAWRIEETPFDGNCDTQMVLRYIDGKTYRWAKREVVESDGAEETITTDPHTHILLNFHPGTIRQDSHEVEFPIGLGDTYSLTFERDKNTWISHGPNSSSDEARVSKMKGFHILEGSGTLRASYDSGHYCCSVESQFIIVDSGHGTLMTISGQDEETNDNGRKRQKWIDLLKPASAK